jgi:hypothetical protein
MKNGKNIRGALSYNEAKVRAGKAELILASRYGCSAEELSFSQKLKRFSVLNDNCVTSSFNTVHISLNFSAADNIDTEKMQLIARDYMQALGFEKQPYLVYRHNDTAHPHLHIVTTPVKENGRTINLHNLVQRKSEPARKALEETYGLIKAQSRTASQILPCDNPTVIQYGKAETKQAIAQTVRTVSDQWRFSSLEEYNLILLQFRVIADSGEPGSKMRLYKGLHYFIVDAYGEKVGVPIKASSIYTSPTIKNIEKKFAANQIKKQASLKYTAAKVQTVLRKANSRNEFFKQLQEKNIVVVQSANSYLFIDHRNKLVASSSELGIELSSIQALDKGTGTYHAIDLSLVHKLLSPEYTGPELASEFLKKKRKKKS